MSTINPDLQQERNGATFNPYELTIWWDGGTEKYEKRKALGKFPDKVIINKLYSRLAFGLSTPYIIFFSIVPYNVKVAFAE